jgi:multisubunit Na+/H+ antiporter MnhF subunit
MSAWTLAALALVGPLLIAVVAAGRGRPAARLVAIQLASSVGVLLALTLSFADDQPSTIDLALMLALLALPATLLFALFEERWL